MKSFFIFGSLVLAVLTISAFFSGMAYQHTQDRTSIDTIRSQRDSAIRLRNETHKEAIFWKTRAEYFKNAAIKEAEEHNKFLKRFLDGETNKTTGH
jgi:hypothetical protein